MQYKYYLSIKISNMLFINNLRIKTKRKIYILNTESIIRNYNYI